MIYRWACEHCGHEIEVERRVADYRVPPRTSEALGHNHCHYEGWRRVITAPSRIVVPESESQYWNDDNYRE